ncbi:transposase [Mycobacterium avium 05-4293]|nr:transposase [Mycobacterium avium 05-4293]
MTIPQRNIAMALDQSALLEVLDALRNADAADRIKQAAETIYQALIDAELTGERPGAWCK